MISHKSTRGFTPHIIACNFGKYVMADKYYMETNAKFYVDLWAGQILFSKYTKDFTCK